MLVGKKQSDLIASVYEAAIDVDKWPGILDQLAPEVGAKCSALLLVSANNSYDYSISASSTIIPESAKFQYIQDYAAHEKQHFERVAGSSAGTVINERELYSDKSIFDNRPDVVFLRESIGIHERFAMKLNDDPSWLECITFQFALGRENIQAHEHSKLAVYYPHLSRVTQLSRTFSVLRAKYRAVLSVLNRVNMAYVIALSTGEVICLNESASRTFDKKDGLYLTEGMRVRTQTSELDSEIQNAVQLVSDTAVGDGKNSGKLIAVPRKSSGEPFLVEISPLRDATRELDGFLDGALITIIDTEEQSEISTTGLKELYGLTDTEAVVADMMVKGYSNQSIADGRGVSSETVKKQAQAVLSKTKSINRSTLIRRVLSFNLPVS